MAIITYGLSTVNKIRICDSCVDMSRFHGIFIEPVKRRDGEIIVSIMDSLTNKDVIRTFRAEELDDLITALTQLRNGMRGTVP